METGLSFVRRYFPRADLDLANYLLWECSPWPIGSPVEVFTKIAAVVRPKKRGWQRRLSRELRRLHAEWDAELHAISSRPDGQAGTKAERRSR